MTNRVIGIDKTEIINIDILAVDKTKLNQDIYEGVKNNIKEIGRLEYTLQSGEVISSIKILDNLFFGELTIKIVYIPTKDRHSGYRKIYTCMTVGAGNILPDNRDNISMERYRDYVTKVLPWYLQERYGITADFSHTKIQSFSSLLLMLFLFIITLLGVDFLTLMGPVFWLCSGCLYDRPFSNGVEFLSFW